MERTLLFASLFVASIAWTGGFIFHRPANAEGSRLEPIPRRERPYWWLALLLAAAVLLATLPSKPPFAPGSHFGLGYTLGSLLFLLAARLRWRSDESVPFSFIFATVVALTAQLSLIPGGEQDGLAGVATGAGAVSLLLGIAAGEKGDSVPWSRALKLGGAFAVLLCGLAALGLLKDDIASPNNPTAQNGVWTAAGISLAAMLGLGAFIAETLTRRPRTWPGVLGRGGAALWEEDAADRSVGFLVASIVSLAAAGFFSLVVLQETSFAVLFALGLLAGVLMMNLSREGTTERPGGFASPLATVIILGAFMASFATLQGFGAAVMLAGAFIPLLFAPPARGGAGLKVWSFGVALVVYRLFASRYVGPMRGSELSDNYALFGILLGALLPALPAAIARDGALTSVPRVLSAGILSLAAPSAVILFYGPKAGPSLLVGLALSSALRGYAFVSLWALLIGISLTQWGAHLFPLAELSRLERLRLLLLVAGGTAVVLIAADLVGRFRRKQ